MNISKNIFSLAIARAMESLGVSVLIVIIPLYIAEGYIGTGSINVEIMIGIAISAASLFSSVGQPFSGYILDKYYKPKLMILVGLTLITISFPLYLQISTYQELVVLRIIQGIGGALIIPSSVFIINSVSTANTRGYNFGIYNTFRLIGFGSGPVLAGLIVEYGDYSIFSYTISGIEATFILSIGIIITALILVVLFVRDIDQNNSSDEKTNDKTITDIVSIIRSRSFAPILVLSLTSFLLASSIAIFATLENAIIERYNQTSFMFGLQFSASVVANIIFQSKIGEYSDRFGRKLFIILGFVILIPTIISIGYSQTSLQVLVLRFVQGIAIALVFAPSLALAGDISKKSISGLSLSFVTGGFGLGIALGPTISGILYSVGGFSLPFTFSGIVSIVGLVLVILLVRDSDKK